MSISASVDRGDWLSTESHVSTCFMTRADESSVYTLVPEMVTHGDQGRGILAVRVHLGGEGLGNMLILGLV